MSFILKDKKGKEWIDMEESKTKKNEAAAGSFDYRWQIAEWDLME